MLQAAEAWGTTPWEIETGRASGLWLNRYVVYKQEEHRIREDAERKAKLKRGR